MQHARYIEIDAGVRYWEDAVLDGVEDTEGNIPLRNGDSWQPVIELATGLVLRWPQGLEASVHYKVCDDGAYWLLDEARARIFKWKDSYVPAAIRRAGGTGGSSDYIVFSIGGDGRVVSWQPPEFRDDQWLRLPPS